MSFKIVFPVTRINHFWLLAPRGSIPVTTNVLSVAPTYTCEHTGVGESWLK